MTASAVQSPHLTAEVSDRQVQAEESHQTQRDDEAGGKPLIDRIRHCFSAARKPPQSNGLSGSNRRAATLQLTRVSSATKSPATGLLRNR